MMIMGLFAWSMNIHRTQKKFYLTEGERLGITNWKWSDNFWISSMKCADIL